MQLFKASLQHFGLHKVSYGMRSWAFEVCRDSSVWTYGCGPHHLLCIATSLCGQVVAAAGNIQQGGDDQAGGIEAPLESNG